jgi:hypothetical protein
MVDTTSFVQDPNFLKFVRLYFGEETKITFIQEWSQLVSGEPLIKVLLIHVPHWKDDMSKTNDLYERLMMFINLMATMKDYPINLIVDTTIEGQEEYMKRRLLEGEDEN